MLVSMRTEVIFMRKLLCLFLSIALVVTLTAGIQLKPAQAEEAVQYLPVTYTPTYKSVKLKWVKKSKVKMFVIYRANVTKLYKKGKRKLAQGKYKPLAVVSGKTFKYKDTNVKKNKFYAYYVEAYIPQQEKWILGYSSFDDDQQEYEGAYTGLTQPSLFIYYDSTKYVPTSKKIWFAASQDFGVKPKKFIIYKKGPKDKKYKKTNLKPKKNEDKYPYLYKDTKVKANKYYKYKARGYYKLGKKKYYSKYSAVFKVQAKYVENWDEPGSAGEEPSEE